MTNVPRVVQQSHITELLTDDSQVLDLLKKLQSHKSPGSDAIHPSVLKACAVEVMKPLSIIFCSSLESGRRTVTEEVEGS